MLADGTSDRKTRLNRLIWRVFTKKHGITLQQDAVDFLLTKLASSHDVDLSAVEELIEYVASMYAKQEDRPDLVDLGALQGMVDGILKSAVNRGDFAGIDMRDYVQVGSAFEATNWDYDPHTKQFNILSGGSKSILCRAEDKIKAFVRRYDFARQRLLRHERFIGTSSTGHLDPTNSTAANSRLKLSTIKSIKGQSFKEPKCLFGMLSQMVEGEWCLEDPEEWIKLDLSQVQSALDGKYAEGALVLVEGWATPEHFKILTIAMPPAESAVITKALQSHPDLGFEGGAKEIESKETLRQMLAQQQNSKILFFSDMWLDNESLLARFADILLDHSDAPPAVIVLMGRFLTSIPQEGPKAFKAYEAAFDRLASLVSGIRAIKMGTRFVLVPGQDDCFYPNILPRPALPEDLFDSFREARIDFVLASNPCRIKCFTREIVVMRQDVSSLLERAKIMEFNPTTDSNVSCCPTLLDQGHLSPLPLGLQPVQWNMDHALYLYPVPDLLCIGEKMAPTAGIHAGCQYVNPGDFYRSGLSYAMYFPSQGQLQVKQFSE